MREASLRLGDALDSLVRWGVERLRTTWWVWLVPLAVLYSTVHWPMARNVDIMAAVVALGIFAWAVCKPGKALVVLVVFLPLQEVAFGFLLRLGVPVQVLRLGGGLKELLGGSILVAALHALHLGRVRDHRTHQLDGLDKALLVYVAAVTAYVLVPHLFTSFYVSPSWSVRLLAWRADCGYVLLFFAVRHAPLVAATRRRFLRALLALAGFALAVGFYQWAFPASYSHLILMTGRQFEYQTTVLHNNQMTVTRTLGYLTNLNPLRIGSVFLSPFDLADFLLIALAIVLERISRDYRSRSSYVLALLIVAALFASRVRADALGAVVIALIAVFPMPNRPTAARLRLLAAMVVAAAVIAPALAGTRFVNAQGGASSNQGHLSELKGGLTTLLRTPLGLGIGDTAGVGDRFVLQLPGQAGGFTVDNSVLQVGDELGLQALIPWLAMVILTWAALGRASRARDPFAGGVRLAFLAVFIAGMYHQVFVSFAVPWILWAAVGLALKPSFDEPAPLTTAIRSDRARLALVQSDSEGAGEDVLGQFLVSGDDRGQG